MGFLHRILNQTIVLQVRFEDAQRYTVELYRLRYSKNGMVVTRYCPDIEVQAETESLKHALVLVLFSEYGVIDKVADKALDLVEKVIADRDRFNWSLSEGGNLFSFVKREQAKPFLAELEKYRIRIASVSYRQRLEREQVKEALMVHVDEFYKQHLVLKEIITPSPESSVIAYELSRRIRLFVLAAALVVLIGNYWIGQRVQVENQRLDRELRTIRSNNEKKQTQSAQKQKLMLQFYCNSHSSYSLLCDRIAASLPAESKLTLLSVCPVIKGPQPNKEAVIDTGRVTLSGEAVSTEYASRFLTQLQHWIPEKQVRLVSVVQQPGTGSFSFTIEIRL